MQDRQQAENAHLPTAASRYDSSTPGEREARQWALQQDIRQMRSQFNTEKMATEPTESRQQGDSNPGPGRGDPKHERDHLEPTTKKRKGPHDPRREEPRS